MLPEPYDGILIGALLTFTISVITMVLTNYFSQRQWLQQRKIEKKQESLEQVYSPLYFYLKDLSYPLGYLGGYMTIIPEKKATDHQKLFLSHISQKQKEIASDGLKDLLRNNLGAIMPKAFRDDLLYLLSSLERYNRALLNIKETSFQNDYELVKQKLKNYSQLTYCFFVVNKNFTNYLDNLLSTLDYDQSSLKYKTLLSPEWKKIIETLLDEPSKPETDDIFNNFKKELADVLGSLGMPALKSGNKQMLS